MRILLFVLLIGLQPEMSAIASQPGIYQSENSWSWEYEELFAEWLTEVAADPEFFKRHDIAIDCADTTYGFRWIFARIHKLPMLTTTTTDGVVSHESDHIFWNGLPIAVEWYNDKRFLTALDHILHHSWTETLAEDSYPVNLGTLVPGTFFLNLDASKHVDLIYTSDSADPKTMPFQFVSSSVPREVKDTKHLVYWYEDQPKTLREGFRRFLWPVRTAAGWEYVNPEEMPYYSLEQFNLKLRNQKFHNYVYSQAKPHLDQNALAATSLLELKSYIQERIDIVIDGYKACTKSRYNRRKCRSKRSKLYDTWSTPSRDKRIQKHIAATQNEIDRASLGVKWRSHFLSLDVFQINNQVVTLLDVSEIWRKKKYSSKPNAKPERRWGIKLKRRSVASFKLL